jgi:hypothetical protein
MSPPNWEKRKLSSSDQPAIGLCTLSTEEEARNDISEASVDFSMSTSTSFTC